MLTAEQIKTHAFRSAGKGLYRSEDVDAFMEEASAALREAQKNAEELQQSNDELYQRVEALANALNQLRAERELIQKTMIHARKAADEMTAQSQEESEHLRRGAAAEAEKLRTTAQEEAAALRFGAREEMERLVQEAKVKSEMALSQARRQADTIVEEANGRAEQDKARLQAEIRAEQQELTRLQSETGRFRTFLQEIFNRQMALTEQLPIYEEPPKPAPVAQPPVTQAESAAPASDAAEQLPELVAGFEIHLPERQTLEEDTPEKTIEGQESLFPAAVPPVTPLDQLEALEASMEASQP
ncbi:MAG: DivIVA domain-containing protein [Oscillospiraceae bacterium]|jgi:cell division septum initiation protein DivIVA|nr:DivIVA domain-containing protein [Oscillospiraceae bacterium]